MDKVVELGELLDWYGMLLTRRQRSIADQYANENCSLSEIAEREGISRQGVRDALVRSEEQLRGYESALGLIRRFHEQERLYALTRTMVKESALEPGQKEAFFRALDRMEAIWED